MAGTVSQWTNQTCTEYGYFRTTNSPKQPFVKSVSVGMYYQWSIGFFGSELIADVVHEGVTHTYAVYKGMKPNVSRVISVHGTLDPCHRLGFSHDLNPTRPVIIVNGTLHCADMYSIPPTNLAELKNAKLQVQRYVSQWIGE